MGKNMKFVNNFFTKKTGFGFLMVFSTLSLAGSAAYYSVFGLSSLFAGAKTEVIIMASALELAKLVVASYLHNYWNKLGLILKSYLTLGVGILMIITSAGIYGFLTSAYQTTADQLTIVDKQVAVVEMKRDRFSEQLVDYKLEKTQLNSNISELAKGLSNNKIQYTDSLGNVITTTSSSTRRVLTTQLNDMKEQRNKVSIKMETLTDSITSLDLKVLNMESNNEVAAEIGPLRYMAEITGKPMGMIVNWFTLMIVCVFDPLAIAMVLAVNKYLGNGRKEEEVEDYYTARNRMVYERTINNPMKVSVTPETKTKVANELSEDEWEASEKRMGVIGQNGNDGEHYAQQSSLESSMDSEEFIEKLDEKLYGSLSKDYTDGIVTPEESNDDNIKTY